MGYLDIIDSLNDAKVNEGMTESIPKNKNNDIDKLVKALQSCDIDFIPDKYIKCYKSFYNRSSFSKNFVDNVIKWTGMLKNKSNNGAKLYMLCLGDGGRFFMVFEASEVIESFLCWYYKSESNKGVKRCCVDSELYKYVTITGIIFKNLCFGNTSDLQIDVVCSINSGEDGKVCDLIDTLNTSMNMFAHINNGSLIISLLLKS